MLSVLTSMNVLWGNMTVILMRLASTPLDPFFVHARKDTSGMARPSVNELALKSVSTDVVPVRLTTSVNASSAGLAPIVKKIAAVMDIRPVTKGLEPAIIVRI